MCADAPLPFSPARRRDRFCVEASDSWPVLFSVRDFRAGYGCKGSGVSDGQSPQLGALFEGPLPLCTRRPLDQAALETRSCLIARGIHRVHWMSRCNRVWWQLAPLGIMCEPSYCAHLAFMQHTSEFCWHLGLMPRYLACRKWKWQVSKISTIPSQSNLRHWADPLATLAVAAGAGCHTLPLMEFKRHSLACSHKSCYLIISCA
jgi:hypothetical protein